MISSEQRTKNLVMRWKREIKSLAQAWIDAGAEQFALVADDAQQETLYAFPSLPHTTDWAYCVRVPVPNNQAIQLCIRQIPNGGMVSWLAMLEANAMLIAKLFERENELDALTSEIVQNQDLVLALYDLNNTLSRPLDLPQILDALIEQLCRLTGADGGIGYLCHRVAMQKLHNASVIQPESLPGYFETISARRQRLCVTLEDGHSLLLFPLIIPEHAERVDGMIGLISDVPLKSPQIKLAQAVMQQAGTHFQNIFHFEERVLQARIHTELELAQAVQMRLLPKKPTQFAGLDVWGESHPAFDVGGDFYDFFTAQNSPFVFSLGDVSGKGLSAALVMTMVRTAIRSAAAFAPSPLTIMELANQNLYDDFTELAKMTTVFVGKMDVEQRTVTFANAGHSPVVYADPEAAAIMLEADAPPLGVLPDYLGASSSIHLPPGGLLIIATDGFVEAENENGDMYGYTRFLDIIDSIKHMGATQIASALYDSVAAFRGNVPQHDDQTIIVIKNVNPRETTEYHE